MQLINPKHYLFTTLKVQTYLQNPKISCYLQNVSCIIVQ